MDKLGHKYNVDMSEIQEEIKTTFSSRIDYQIDSHALFVVYGAKKSCFHKW